MVVRAIHMRRRRVIPTGVVSERSHGRLYFMGFVGLLSSDEGRRRPRILSSSLPNDGTSACLVLVSGTYVGRHVVRDKHRLGRAFKFLPMSVA